MYTDTDNTGAPTVPRLTRTDETDTRTRRETLEEEVWSHLIEAPTEDGR